MSLESAEPAAHFRTGRQPPAGARRLADIAHAFPLVLLVLLTLATVGRLFARVSWPGDLASFLVPHLAAGALVLVGVALVARRWLIAVLGLVLFGANAATLVWPAPRPELFVSDSTPLRVMTFNVLMGNGQLTALKEFLRRERPDIVALQEAYLWENELGDLADLYPYRSNQLVGHRSGVALLSRYPVEKILTFKGTEQPVPAELNLNAIEARLRVDDVAVEVLVVHPPTPRTLGAWRGRNDYYRNLAERVDRMAANASVIVLGDFNAAIWSPNLQAFLRRSGLVDAAASNWPSPTRIPLQLDLPDWLGTPVDHVFVSPGIGVDGFVVGPELGSDHLPIIATLSVPKPR